MCKTYAKLPDDPFITEMDPIKYLWMFENWNQDHSDQVELSKYLGYLVGSFFNPEAVQELTNQNKHTSTEEEFDETSDLVRNIKDINDLINPKSNNPIDNKEVTRRKRKRLK